MLVSELRKEIKNYKTKDLEDIIVELYKRVPKYKKEEYNIDDFIKNIKSSKTQKNTKKKISFAELKTEIKYFLDCVDKEYYVMPNRIISKKERSSWRFKVKRYYKALSEILPDSKNGDEATELLIEIFKRLSIGSNRLLFINWETFRALGVTQGEYYDCLIKRILYNGYTRENLEKCIKLLDFPSNPYELSFARYYVLVSNLKTIDNKVMTIDILSKKVTSARIELKKNKNNFSLEYDLTETINNCTQCIFEIYCLMKEADNGIAYFHENYIECSQEIVEYVLLNELYFLDLIDEWIKEYEDNVSKIDFRNSLKEQYILLKGQQNNSK